MQLLSVDLPGRVVTLIVVGNGQLLIKFLELFGSALNYLETVAHLGKIGRHIAKLRRLQLMMLVRVLPGNLLEYREHLFTPIAKLGEWKLTLGVRRRTAFLSCRRRRWVPHPLGAEIETSKIKIK